MEPKERFFFMVVFPSAFLNTYRNPGVLTDIKVARQAANCYDGVVTMGYVDMGRGGRLIATEHVETLPFRQWDVEEVPENAYDAFCD